MNVGLGGSIRRLAAAALALTIILVQLTVIVGRAEAHAIVVRTDPADGAWTWASGSQV